MNGPQDFSSIAPWVNFVTVAVEDRSKQIAEGVYGSKDVDYAHITPPGSKDCVERPVAEWFEALQRQVEDKRFPPEWLDSYRRRYEQWKESGEIPVEGTALKNWALLSPAQLDQCLKLRVRSVEQLATANEDVIRGLGMGGRTLVEQAKAFVKQTGAGGSNALAAENADLKAKLEQSEATRKELEDALSAAQAQLKAMAQVIPVAASPASTTIDSSDLLDAAPQKL